MELTKEQEALEKFCIENCENNYRYGGDGECLIFKSGNCKPREVLQQAIDELEKYKKQEKKIVNKNIKIAYRLMKESGYFDE